MKPFNLEAAKAGAPCKTRSNDKAELIHCNFAGNMPLVFKRTNNEGHETIFITHLDGKVLTEGDKFSDIFMAPAKTSTWLNIYPRPCHTDRAFSSYSTKEEAEKNAYNDRIACVYVEWEE